MPSAARVFRHSFGGGYATDLGTLAEVAPADGRVEIPFLLEADNIYFTRSGGVRKIGGTSKYNATVLQSGQEVRAMFEYVRQGTGGSPTRKKIAVAGTKILKDDNDGDFDTELFTIADNGVTCFCVFEDLLIITTDQDEAPMEWDQTTATTLGGTPPNFAFAVAHVNRVWAAGDPANPSTLYYSSLLEPEEWEGVGNSGVIDIDPNDGDVITAIFPFRGELIVFKGPNHGSIHRVAGTTPSTFSRTVLSRGVSAAGQNLLFELAGGTDLGFVAQDTTVRSLLATDRFGDYAINAYSEEIETALRDVTVSALKRGYSVTDPARGYTLLTLPVNGASIPDYTIMMDTRFQRPRFAPWPAIECHSLALMSDPGDSNRLIVYAGGNDGFIRKLQQATRAIDGSPIAARVQTPFFNYGLPFQKKTLGYMGVSVVPHGSETITFGFETEDGAGDNHELQSGSGVPLGEFMLGEDTLGGSRHSTLWDEVIDSGSFRDIAYAVSNTDVNEDMEVQQIYAVLEGSQVESVEN